MRVLIIGGTGFIGPGVVRRLASSGHRLAVFHRGQTQAELPASVHHIYGDRRRLAASADELRRFEPEVVLDMFPMTGEDVGAMLEAMRGVARRMVAISSQDVYRAYGRAIGIEPGPPDPLPLAEDAPLRARLFPYRGDPHRGSVAGAETYEKMLAERVVLSDPHLAGTVLRLPMVYGPRDPQHRLFDYLKRMDDGRGSILLDESLARWRWTHGYVQNVADAIALAVVDERAAGRVYNVGEPYAFGRAAWIREIGRAAGWVGEVVAASRQFLPEYLRATIDPAHELVTNTTRIRAELGYTERVPVADALERTVEWERAHPPADVDLSRFDYAAEDAALAAIARAD
jgi:nucleoside-diphosphate-sugar epimerase